MKPGRHAIAAILLATAITGCKRDIFPRPYAPVFETNRAPAEVLGTTRADAVAGFNVVGKLLDAYEASYSDAGNAAKAQSLTRWGLTVTRMRCDMFFENVGRRSQNLDFSRRAFQSLTGALTTVLGLANADPDAIAAFGVGGTLGSDYYDGYSAVYFFAPDISAVRRMVRRAYATLEQSALRPEATPRNFNEAIEALMVFQNVCTAHEIKRLVTQSIEATRLRAQSPADAALSEAATDALDTLANQLGVPLVNLREAALLELLLQRAPATLTAAQVSYICQADLTLRSALCDPTPGAANPYALKASVAGDRAALLAALDALKAASDGVFALELEAQRGVVVAAAPQLAQNLQQIAAAKSADQPTATLDAEQADILSLSKRSSIAQGVSRIPTGVTVESAPD